MSSGPIPILVGHKRKKVKIIHDRMLGADGNE
jgi:hypothetical protein